MPACGGKDDGDDDGSTGASNATPATPATTTMGVTDGAGTMLTEEPMTSGTTHATHSTHETGEPMTSTTSDDTTGGGALSCADYCATIATSCTGAETQWGNLEFCMASCAAFPPGTAADTTTNTLGCRTYHAGAAAGDPATHCVHAGPGGANACGSNCEGFCAIGMAACPDKWADAAACMTACAGFDDSEKYDATDIAGNTLACRLYHATAASVDAATHCGHIGGDSPPCM